MCISEKSTRLLRFRRSEAGIAIGPILFVIALLAVLAAAMSAGGGGFGLAGTTDRVAIDIFMQANLIRTKINECNITYGTTCDPILVQSGTCDNYDGYPSSLSGGVVTPTLVSALNCKGAPTGQQNLWTGARPVQLPAPTKGFNPWYYVNSNAIGPGGSATGGRCIYATTSNTDSGTTAGLTRAAKKFTHATTNDGTSEVNYDSSHSPQKFVLWITLPTGTPDTNCTP